MDWEHLERAVAAEAHGEALRIALEGWRTHRHPRLADVVDAVAKGAPAFDANGDFHRAWLAAVGSAEELGPLLKTLGKALPESDNAYRWPPPPSTERYAAWLERVVALDKREDDPRTATALLEVVASAPWVVGENILALFEPAMALIVRIADVRTIARMETLLMKPVARRQGMRKLLAELFPKAIAAVAQTRTDELDVQTLARVEAIAGPAVVAASAPRGDEDALFALVAADLDSDEPRAVLADHWLERGNPRGEYVSEQLAGKPPKSPRKHEREWLGDLGAVTKNRVWQRGFLTQIELANNAAADPAVWEAARASRDLQTVERIEKGKANEALFLSFVAAARGLKTLTPASKSMALYWADWKEPWPVTHLELAFKVDVKLAKTLIASRAFPHVEKVSFGAKDVETLMAVARVFAGSGLRQLAALSTRCHFASANELGDFLAEPFDGAERSIDTRPWSHIVARGSSPLHLEATCQNLYYVSAVLERFRLMAVPVASLSLRLPSGMDAPQPLPNAIAAGLLEGIALDADKGWSVALAEAK